MFSCAAGAGVGMTASMGKGKTRTQLIETGPAAERTWTRARPGTSGVVEYEVPDLEDDGKG
jgi:hypothetical protein